MIHSVSSMATHSESIMAAGSRGYIAVLHHAAGIRVRKNGWTTVPSPQSWSVGEGRGLDLYLRAALKRAAWSLRFLAQSG